MIGSVFVLPADNNTLAEHIAERRKMLAGPGWKLRKGTMWKL
jgi:hypothetical protein